MTFAADPSRSFCSAHGQICPQLPHLLLPTGRDNRGQAAQTRRRVEYKEHTNRASIDQNIVTRSSVSQWRRTTLPQRRITFLVNLIYDGKLLPDIIRTVLDAYSGNDTVLIPTPRLQFLRSPHRSPCDYRKCAEESVGREEPTDVPRPACRALEFGEAGGELGIEVGEGA